MSRAPLADQATNLPTPRSPLIGREREVAATRALLLAAAVPLLTLTDKEIGEALSISHRTARTHVTYILNKLGVAK